MPREWVDAAVPVIAWLVGLRLASTRNRRFVLFAALWTVCWIAAPTTTSALRIGLVALMTLAIAAPEYLRLGSITRGEQAADALINEIPTATASTVSAWVEALEQVRGKIGDDRMRLLGARLRLWAKARREMPVVPETTTPTEHYELAATHFLHDVRWGRVLGAKRLTTAWDEGIALAAFHEQAQALIPRGALIARPIVSLGDWTREVEQLVEDLRVAPIRDDVIGEARWRLVDATLAELDMARGDRSPAAIRRQADTAQAMMDAWRRTSARLSELRGVTSDATEA